MVYSTQYAVAGFCAAGSVLTVVLVVFMYCFKRQGGGDVPDQIDQENQEMQPDDRQREGVAPAIVYNADGDCPICLSRPELRVITNCGHVYCLSCVLDVFDHAAGQNAERPKCPICREYVHSLIDAFRDDERGSPQALQAADRVRTFNRRFAHLLDERPWYRMLAEIPHMLGQVINRPLILIRLILRVRAIMVLGLVLAYVLSPLDVIPESIFGALGLLDDFIVMAAVGVWFIGIAYAVRRRNEVHGQGEAADAEHEQREVGGQGEAADAGHEQREEGGQGEAADAEHEQREDRDKEHSAETRSMRRRGRRQSRPSMD